MITPYFSDSLLFTSMEMTEIQNIISETHKFLKQYSLSQVQRYYDYTVASIAFSHNDFFIDHRSLDWPLFYSENLLYRDVFYAHDFLLAE